MHNPSLREESQDQQAPIIPSRQQSSILDWLADSGRLIPREGDEREVAQKDEDEEINELMSSDSGNYFETEDDSDSEG